MGKEKRYVVREERNAVKCFLSLGWGRHACGCFPHKSQNLVPLNFDLLTPELLSSSGAPDMGAGHPGTCNVICVGLIRPGPLNQGNSSAKDERESSIKPS